MDSAFDANGNLPPGEHTMTWSEIVQRFGGNDRRRELLDGLHDLCLTLQAASCETLWLDGSFVTSKDEPGDFDAVSDHHSVPDLAALGELFLKADQRDARKARWAATSSITVQRRRAACCFSTSSNGTASTDRRAL